MYFAEEFEFYPVGGKMSWEDFQHRESEIMPDYIEGSMKTIYIGDGKSLPHFN